MSILLIIHGQLKFSICYDVTLFNHSQLKSCEKDKKGTSQSPFSCPYSLFLNLHCLQQFWNTSMGDFSLAMQKVFVLFCFSWTAFHYFGGLSMIQTSSNRGVQKVSVLAKVKEQECATRRWKVQCRSTVSN